MAWPRSLLLELPGLVATPKSLLAVRAFSSKAPFGQSQALHRGQPGEPLPEGGLHWGECWEEGGTTVSPGRGLGPPVRERGRNWHRPTHQRAVDSVPAGPGFPKQDSRELSLPGPHGSRTPQTSEEHGPRDDGERGS